MDFKTLQKLESVPGSMQAKPRDPEEDVLVLLKLRKGHSVPGYVRPRARISGDIVSGEIRAGDLERLAEDPAIESMSLSKALPVIE
ncbi:hypothetical protein B5K11_26325 [Rhizobium leguminosarum bv. trifolii]|uniref:hypothetical protein n=1 Tax=Rhizobium leguminosarum TaxID=384 RepID=UPI000E2EA7DC|nr:hypothetical protein [Rhizobium leguminosarum]RFB87663.1 hypothetical protein B5K11_26325 [Rhizobium leguminosarum bv. trifolii]